ncbi:MAG: cytochrome c maturation protein CcmE [Lentisphaeria bacterium]|nr:cytochrome c maturation protein CcmE [Candidatus Neomarinimicrobiota bacterium]MCF7841550.1 cytochrome c maturation protein CcmE [Lentisphaeria bacterium]
MSSSNKKVKFIVGIGIIVVAVVALALSGFKKDYAYFKTVTEVYSMGPRAYDHQLKVKGDLVKGTVVKTGAELNFQITEGGQTMDIHYIGTDPIPDTFNNEMDAEVVVSGRLAQDNVFKAERIQAKCASKYEADYSGDAQASL